MNWNSSLCGMVVKYMHFDGQFSAPVAATHSTLHLVNTSALHRSSGGCVRRQLVENRQNILACKRWTFVLY